MTTDYTDLIAALHLPIHGAQQEWTCRKAAHALAALTIERDASNKLAVQAFAKAEAMAGEVATLNIMVTDWIEAFDKQKARAEAAEAERDCLKAELSLYHKVMDILGEGNADKTAALIKALGDAS